MPVRRERPRRAAGSLEGHALKRLAILLCAGYGTRMGEAGRRGPKALLPVAGRPLIDPLMEELAALPGLDAVHLVSNRLWAGRFRRWARRWRPRLASAGRRLVVHDDGTARRAERRGAVVDLDLAVRRAGVPEGGALVAGSDNLFLFPLAPLWASFLSTGRDLLLAVREDDAEARARSTLLELGSDDHVVRVDDAVHGTTRQAAGRRRGAAREAGERTAPDMIQARRPPVQETRVASPGWVSPALYCLTSKTLGEVSDYLKAGGDADSLGAFVADLARRRPVWAHRASGRRLHVGTPAAYRAARKLLEGPGADPSAGS